MSLKDMFALVDEKLKDAFETRKKDPAELRAPVLKSIEKTRDQFGQTEPVRGRKWFQVNNNIVAFSPTLRGGTPLVMNGKSTVYVPSERFPEFLSKMEAAVKAGEFDEAIEAKGNGAGHSTAIKVPRAPRKPRDPNAPAKPGWTPERRAKFEATVAARNAAK